MLGMIGGPQEMNLGNDLTSGTAAHEMMHALGISHEHQRFDRDDWITIDWQALATFDTAESKKFLCYSCHYGTAATEFFLIIR